MSQLRRNIAGWRKLFRDQLRQGCACSDAQRRRFCKNLLAVEPALWTFVRIDGVAPTNNHIERVLRSAVLWRKNAFGCHSEAGCRFVKRILTAVQTLRRKSDPCWSSCIKQCWLIVMEKSHRNCYQLGERLLPPF